MGLGLGLDGAEGARGVADGVEGADGQEAEQLLAREPRRLAQAELPQRGDEDAAHEDRGRRDAPGWVRVGVGVGVRGWAWLWG